MIVSENISLRESIRSQTAQRRGIDNYPSEEVLSAMKLTAQKVFEPVRKHFKRPIFISSFYRSEELNLAIGGSRNSQHCKGEAIDIDCDQINDQIFYFIKNNLIYDQLIWEFGTEIYPAWVHVSYTQERNNRMQTLKAIRSNGKVLYQNL